MPTWGSNTRRERRSSKQTRNGPRPCSKKRRGRTLMKKRTKNRHRAAAPESPIEQTESGENPSWLELQRLLKLIVAGMDLQPTIDVHGETPDLSYHVHAEAQPGPRVRR